MAADGQSLDAQIKALRVAGAEEVYSEPARGKAAARVADALLKRVIEKLGGNDLLLVTRLDRVARSTHELLSRLTAIAERKAVFRSLAEPWVDTTARERSTLLPVLEGLIVFEEQMAAENRSIRRARSKARGERMGRPEKLTETQKMEIVKHRNNPKKLAAIAQEFGISRWTVKRTVDAYAERQVKTKSRAEKARKKEEREKKDRVTRAQQNTRVKQPSIVSLRNRT